MPPGESSVRLDSTRKAKGITWVDEVDGSNPLDGDEVVVVAQNMDTGDVHNKAPIPNTGFAALIFPVDFTGKDLVTVTDEDGNVVEGEISV